MKKMLKQRTKLSSTDYSATQKAQYMDALVAEGCTQSTAYNRLFRDGFDDWELAGVLDLMREFVRVSGMPEDTPLDERFYSSLPSCIDFKIFMRARGMSFNTTTSRFKSWDFKPWELKGVNPILKSCPSLKE